MRVMAAGTTVFILLTLIVLHSSAQQQCDDVNYRDETDYESPESDVSVCFMLSDGLEKALISGLNLHRLRRVFFPNDDIEPAVVTVTYRFQIGAASVNNTCPGVRENNAIKFLNYTKNYIWTSSRVFSKLHHEVIDWLLPTIIYIFFPVSNTYFNTQPSLNHETVLILDASSFSCIPSSDQVDAVLADLTTLLKAYADAQGLITRRRFDNKGYVTVDKAVRLAYVFFFFPMAVLISTIPCLYARVIAANWVHKLLQNIMTNAQKTAAQKTDYKLFLSVHIATTIANWAVILFEIIGYIAWIVDSVRGDVNGMAIATLTAKFCIFLLLVFPGALFIAWFTVNKIPVGTSKKTLRDLLIDLSVPEGLQFAAKISFAFDWCCWQKIKDNHTIMYLIVWNFLCFALIAITWCLMPFLIVIFISPIQGFIILFLLLLSYFLLLASFALGLLGVKKICNLRGGPLVCATDFCKLHECTPNRCLNTVVTLGTCIIILFLFGLYVYFVRIGINTGGIVGVAVSVVPAVLTAAVALLSRWLLRKYRKRQDAESDDQIDFIPLQDIETANKLL